MSISSKLSYIILFLFYHATGKSAGDGRNKILKQEVSIIGRKILFKNKNFQTVVLGFSELLQFEIADHCS